MISLKVSFLIFLTKKWEGETCSCTEIRYVVRLINEFYILYHTTHTKSHAVHGTLDRRQKVK